MSDEDYHNLTGISKDNFNSIITTCSETWERQRKVSIRTSVGVFLVKLKTGNSSAVLSTLFRMSKAGINRAVTRARDVMSRYFVPLHLGIHMIYTNTYFCINSTQTLFLPSHS